MRGFISRRFITVFQVTVAALVALGIASCRQAVEEPPPPAGVEVVAAEELPLDPAADVWDGAPEFTADLILQDMVEPRLMTPSTSQVRVKAISDGQRVAFRLQWADQAQDDLSVAGQFSDACAIQLPALTQPDLPAPQMGEPGRPVQITFWSAAWQALVDGRGSSLNDIYPNASIDHYPFEAPSLEEGSPEQQAMEHRYAPARRLGNLMAGPRDTPVEDLTAEGPGTLAPGPPLGSSGIGQRDDDGWTVIITRPLPEGLSPEQGTHVALAVWDGAREEVGARKMRTTWIPLTMKESP